MNPRDTAQESTQMSEVPPATDETPHVVEDADVTPREDVILRSAPPRVEVEVSPAPTLITEQQVVFSTKAAAAARHTRWWTGAFSIIAVATRRIFVSSRTDSRPTRRDYPPRHSYLEYSRMEREMHKL
jgi:hypothetical protein